MSRWAILLTAVALLMTPFAVAAPVPAGPKADESVPLRAAKLLAHSKVQREIKMTAEQRVTLLDAMEDIEERWVQEFLRARELALPGQRAASQKADQIRDKAFEKLMANSTEKVLTPAQRSRLRQIDYQLRGPDAFADESVQKLLKFDAAQIEAATALAEQVRTRALDLASPGEKWEEVKAEHFKFRKESVDKFTNRFTAVQRDTWRAMLGEPVKGFDVGELWLRNNLSNIVGAKP